MNTEVQQTAKHFLPTNYLAAPSKKTHDADQIPTKEPTHHDHDDPPDSTLEHSVTSHHTHG
ncbi:hypothetical protein ES319_D12G099000v1 [Gossypium barbadense]|uniref:Uncharacterized protein n=1 Tax=Gossypium barbadense TaxID=3634 RepID=A0A5J5P0M5_GOSBA|nr:hypothetical protein ES319_D12G099000v1 [Gossypium barbadense]